ncbi:MAG: LuxR C-terminal-related transcriptional regulator [Veillonellales bacterium]
MNSKSQPKFDRNSAKKPYVLSKYNSQEIINIIRHYYELKSAAEITVVQYGHVGGGSNYVNGKDDIMCVLADLDYGVNGLSARQREVVMLLKTGYLIKEISKIMGVRRVTVNFHIRQVGLRLADYLNASRIGRRWTR